MLYQLSYARVGGHSSGAFFEGPPPQRGPSGGS